MGGPGSGEWPRLNRKRTVETSLSLSVGDFGSKIHATSEGYLLWRSDRETLLRAKYTLFGPAPRSIQLEYVLDSDRTQSTRIEMTSTPTAFNGSRWWFTCPISRGGAPCRKRVWKLYLPTADSNFGCRGCHDLRYESSQQAHREERLLNRLGYPADRELLNEFKQHLRSSNFIV